MGYKRRRTNVPARLELLQRTQIRCLCGKVSASSNSEAKKLRKRIERKYRGGGRVRFYQCEYGQWHWTRQL